MPKETVHALYEYLYQTMQCKEKFNDVFFKSIQFPIQWWDLFLNALISFYFIVKTIHTPKKKSSLDIITFLVFTIQIRNLQEFGHRMLALGWFSG